MAFHLSVAVNKGVLLVHLGEENSFIHVREYADLVFRFLFYGVKPFSIDTMYYSL